MHFETSLVMVSHYDYESSRWSIPFWEKMHVFSTFFNNKSKKSFWNTATYQNLKGGSIKYPPPPCTMVGVWLTLRVRPRVKRPRPPFGRPNESSHTVVTSVKQLSSAWYFYFGFSWRIWWKKILFEKGVDDHLWTSNASPIAHLFRNKVMFLLMIMLTYDKPI